MSVSSSSSYSLNASAVKQSGVLTFNAAGTCTVPISTITALDTVLISCKTATAGANKGFNTTITAGTGFTAVAVDDTYAGTADYVVITSQQTKVNITSG